MNSGVSDVTDYYLETKTLPDCDAVLSGMYLTAEVPVNLVEFQRREREHMTGGVRKGFIRPPS